jgi:hypothetical protein
LDELLLAFLPALDDHDCTDGAVQSGDVEEHGLLGQWCGEDGGILKSCFEGLKGIQSFTRPLEGVRFLQEAIERHGLVAESRNEATKSGDPLGELLSVEEECGPGDAHDD